MLLFKRKKPLVQQLLIFFCSVYLWRSRYFLPEKKLKIKIASFTKMIRGDFKQYTKMSLGHSCVIYVKIRLSYLIDGRTVTDSARNIFNFIWKYCEIDVLMQWALHNFIFDISFRDLIWTHTCGESSVVHHLISLVPFMYRTLKYGIIYQLTLNKPSKTQTTSS